jgi:hypothetical protein
MGIRQEGGRERQREKDLERGGEQHSSERKGRGLIFDCWSESTTLASAQHLRIY